MGFLNSMIYSTSLIIFTLIAFIATTVALIIQFSHFLMSLFCLERIILCIVLFIPLIYCTSTLLFPQIRIILLTFGACEASLGLRILVVMSRSYGSDIINNLSINKC